MGRLGVMGGEQEGVGVRPDPDGGVIGARAKALAPEVQSTDFLRVAGEDDGLRGEMSESSCPAVVLGEPRVWIFHLGPPGFRGVHPGVPQEYLTRRAAAAHESIVT